MNIPDYVNELPPTSRVGLLDDYLVEEDLDAPIDMFHTSVAKILQYGTETRLDRSKFLGRLMFLGVVSAAEAYFRAVLSSCLELCPIARATAAKKSISLGGSLWHGQAGFSRSVFENSSFTSKQELVSACREFLGVPLSDVKFGALFEQCEIICQLRHGIVHSDGLLPGKNAVQLDIKKYSRPIRITVGYEQLQDVTAVVTTLVMTLNRELFDTMCRRWAVEWRKRVDWNRDMERSTFTQIWNIFHCSTENKSRKGRSRINKRSCLDDVKLFYNLA